MSVIATTALPVYSLSTSLRSPSWIAFLFSGEPDSDRCGSHWMRTDDALRACSQFLRLR